MANRDYKNAGRSRASQPSAQRPVRHKKTGMAVGIVIGLIGGIGAAAVLTYFMTRSQTPFVSKEISRPEVSQQGATPTVLEPNAVAVAPESEVKQKVDAVPESASQVSGKVGESNDPAAQATEQSTANSGAEAVDKSKSPNYEFYKILPGLSEAVPSRAPADKSTERQEDKKNLKLYLQLGAFGNTAEADNLKARLALSGLEAQISSIDVPEKGRLHRVRVGPYEDKAEADRVLAQLRQEGVSATPVRE